MLQQHRSCFSFGGSFFLGARMKRYSSTMSKACRSSCKSVRLNSNKEHLPDTLILQRWSILLQVRLGDHRETPGRQRFLGQVDVIDHQGDHRATVRPDQQGVSLDDVHLGL